MNAPDRAGTDNVRPRSFVFAGGGTGGHLYPAIAIREALLDQRPDAETLFICSDKELDGTILTREEVEWTAIPARPLALRPGALARLAWNWGRCVRVARSILRRQTGDGRSPIVIAMGGYVAAPIAQAASVEGAPIVMLNLDAPPGKANRLIARRADAVLTAADVPERPAWRPIRPLVRRAAHAQGSARECRAAMGLDSERPLLFITGASQGARSINAFMLAFARKCSSALTDWQVLHQCGAADQADLEETYETHGVQARVVPYCDDMASAWGGAELAVSRSGAGSVGEIWANRTPTLCLPYPYHHDDHQRANALPLECAGGVVIEEDLVDPERNLERAGSVLRELLAAPEERDRMRAALQELGPADGAQVVADLLASM